MPISKLKLNNGDIKATQGDSGHTKADMITNRYAHIVDDDRKVNAQKFDQSFYNAKDSQEDKLQSVLKALQASPKALEILSNLLTT